MNLKNIVKKYMPYYKWKSQILYKFVEENEIKAENFFLCNYVNPMYLIEKNFHTVLFNELPECISIKTVPYQAVYNVWDSTYDLFKYIVECGKYVYFLFDNNYFISGKERSIYPDKRSQLICRYKNGVFDLVNSYNLGDGENNLLHCSNNVMEKIFNTMTQIYKNDMQLEDDFFQICWFNKNKVDFDCNRLLNQIYSYINHSPKPFAIFGTTFEGNGNGIYDILSKTIDYYKVNIFLELYFHKRIMIWRYETLRNKRIINENKYLESILYHIFYKSQDAISLFEEKDTTSIVSILNDIKCNELEAFKIMCELLERN